MKSLLKKVGDLARQVEQEKGEPFTLFALVLPEDAIAWDIVAAAPWMDADWPVALRYVAEKAQMLLPIEDLRQLAGIFPLNTKLVHNHATSSEITTGWVERDPDFYGRSIVQAYVYAAPAQVVVAS